MIGKTLKETNKREKNKSNFYEKKQKTLVKATICADQQKNSVQSQLAAT
jgi:hypothetical protein